MTVTLLSCITSCWQQLAPFVFLFGCQSCKVASCFLAVMPTFLAVTCVRMYWCCSFKFRICISSHLLLFIVDLFTFVGVFYKQLTWVGIWKLESILLQRNKGLFRLWKPKCVCALPSFLVPSWMAWMFTSQTRLLLYSWLENLIEVILVGCES